MNECKFVQVSSILIRKHILQFKSLVKSWNKILFIQFRIKYFGYNLRCCRCFICPIYWRYVPQIRISFNYWKAFHIFTYSAAKCFRSNACCVFLFALASLAPSPLRLLVSWSHFQIITQLRFHWCPDAKWTKGCQIFSERHDHFIFRCRFRWSCWLAKVGSKAREEPRKLRRSSQQFGKHSWPSIHLCRFDSSSRRRSRRSIGHLSCPIFGTARWSINFELVEMSPTKMCISRNVKKTLATLKTVPMRILAIFCLQLSHLARKEEKNSISGVWAKLSQPSEKRWRPRRKK